MTQLNAISIDWPFLSSKKEKKPHLLERKEGGGKERKGKEGRKVKEEKIKCPKQGEREKKQNKERNKK